MVTQSGVDMVSDSSRPVGPPDSKGDSREARQARLEKALRANLKRRRIQAHGRSRAAPPGSRPAQDEDDSGS